MPVIALIFWLSIFTVLGGTIPWSLIDGIIGLFAMVAIVVFALVMIAAVFGAAWLVASLVMGLVGIEMPTLFKDPWKEAVSEHRASLRANYIRSQDEYGMIDPQKWAKQIERFAHSISRAKDGKDASRLDIWCAKMAINAEPAIVAKTESEAPLDPIAFEHYCATLLRKTGWKARTTVGSGDQGADVIAELDGEILVVQCKRYSRAVGNKAVQEAAAARSFYDADYAAVVTTSSFTPGAMKLAKASEVSLLTICDLEQFEPLGA